MVKGKNTCFRNAHFNSSFPYLPHDGSQTGFSITQNLREVTFLIEATFSAYRYVLDFTTSKNPNYLCKLQSYSIHSLVPKYASMPLPLRSTFIHRVSTGSVLIHQPLSLTYLLTPRSRVLLGKLTGSAASQEIPRIFGTRRFLTVLRSARHLCLSWANSIQSPQHPPTSWRSILNRYHSRHKFRQRRRQPKIRTIISQLCKRDLRSSVMLRSVDRYLVTDVSKQPIGPIFFLDCFTLEEGNEIYPETSVTNYKSMLCNIAEERRYRLYGVASVKSRKFV